MKKYNNASISVKETVFMPKAKSEYEVEELYIDRLDDMGYQYVNLKNYDDVCANFREQFCKLNAKELIAAKGAAKLSNAEFDRVMIRLENHTIYESAKILREKWVLELDNGKSIYVVNGINQFEISFELVFVLQKCAKIPLDRRPFFLKLLRLYYW
jgi:hypothetical protein